MNIRKNGLFLGEFMNIILLKDVLFCKGNFRRFAEGVKK